MSTNANIYTSTIVCKILEVAGVWQFGNFGVINCFVRGEGVIVVLNIMFEVRGIWIQKPIMVPGIKWETHSVVTFVKQKTSEHWGVSVKDNKVKVVGCPCFSGRAEQKFKD
jgi:hypothetical protein